MGQYVSMEAMQSSVILLRVKSLLNVRLQVFTRHNNKHSGSSL